jgi:hypothetical protein
MIIKVAVFLEKHSALLGHADFSQIECKEYFSKTEETKERSSYDGALTFGLPTFFSLFCPVESLIEFLEHTV